MELKRTKFGTVDLVISIEESAVDSYIQHAFSVSLDRVLNDHEIETLEKEYSEEIQMYAYQNGSRNHN